MDLILEQLREDHRKLVRVLYHLEKQAKALVTSSDIEVGIESVIDMLDYIQAYPEIWHHPTEDVIFEVLLKKNVPDVSRLSEAMEEHEVLELLTENLFHHLDLAASGDGFSAARFIKAINIYVNRQLRHMEFEQRFLFPLATQFLDKSDWSEIKTLIKKRSQASEDARLQKYSIFYQDLANSSVVTAH